jgi:hypothetical protein
MRAEHRVVQVERVQPCRKRLREAKQALDAEREADAEPIVRDRGQRLRECRRRLEHDYELERRLIAEHDASSRIRWSSDRRASVRTDQGQPVG